MPITATVIAHQNQHHMGGQSNKSRWSGNRNIIDPCLIAYVNSKENDLRQAIQNEKINRDPAGEIRNVFYITDLFPIDLFPAGSYPNSYNGFCIEVVVAAFGENLKVDIHGYPATVNKVGISLSMRELCS